MRHSTCSMPTPAGPVKAWHPEQRWLVSPTHSYGVGDEGHFGRVFDVMIRKIWRQILGVLVGLVIWLVTAGGGKAEAERMARLDFSANTQKMGLRFTEQLRDAWRRRWFKIKH